MRLRVDAVRAAQGRSMRLPRGAARSRAGRAVGLRWAHVRQRKGRSVRPLRRAVCCRAGAGHGAVSGRTKDQGWGVAWGCAGRMWGSARDAVRDREGRSMLLRVDAVLGAWGSASDAVWCREGASHGAALGRSVGQCGGAVCGCARGAAQGRAGPHLVAAYGCNLELGWGGSVEWSRGEAYGLAAPQCATVQAHSVGARGAAWDLAGAKCKGTLGPSVWLGRSAACGCAGALYAVAFEHSIHVC